MPEIDWGAAAVILAAVIAVFQGVRYVFRKVFNLGDISRRLTTVEATVGEIKADMGTNYKELNSGVSNILKMLAEKGLAQSNSPRVLTEEGKKVLVNSGIDTIVDDKYDLIVREVDALKPENSYQAEQAVLDVVASFKKDETMKDAIEEGAFKSGYFVDSVLFTGGLYIRDRVLKELGFDIDEIDKHKPAEKQ